MLITLGVYAFYLFFPVLIYFDINYVNSKDENIGLGVGLFLLTTVGLLMYNVGENYHRFRVSQFGINLSSTINLAIFQKALKFPLLASRRFSEADIINLSQIDAENLNQVAAKAIFLLFGVVQVIVELSILYIFIGWLFIIPLVIVALISLINFCIGKSTIGLS
jgi:ABC-type bacteriocin/lantibiotic exporter with double-glycine peptidase domain